MGLLDGGATGFHGHLASAAEATWVTKHADPIANKASFSIGDKATVGGADCVLVTNRSGGATSQGYLVSASTSYDDAFRYTPVNNPDPFGVVVEAGIADGAACWVAFNGIADVYFGGSATHGQLARSPITADGYSDGQAAAEALPSPPFATDNHFREIGHVLHSRTGAGLAKCAIHFN